MTDIKDIEIGDLVWFDPGESAVGWANHGFVNDDPKRFWPYVPCWTERQKGEATTFMVHKSNIQKVGKA